MRISYVTWAATCAAFALALLLSGCTDHSPSPTALPPELTVPTDIPQDIQEQLELLGRVAAMPDGGVSYWASGGAEQDGQPVELPAGSVNGLAAALTAAGDNGTVIVKSGQHTESGMVTVTQKVRIIGEPGAIMVFDTPSDPTGYDLHPAIRVQTNNVTIWGLEIRPPGIAGGTAVLLDGARNSLIANNTFRDQHLGVFVEGGDLSMIWGNTIINAPSTVDPMGIVNCNGKRVRIANNDVTNGVFGIWACDEDGVLTNNTAHGNFIGIILCHVPPDAYTLPGNVTVGSESPAQDWVVTKNVATDNAWGYLVIDGSNNNLLSSNAASNSSFYDVELTADTYRFGFLTPASFNNRFVAGSYSNIIVKNCGNNNTIVGGQLVDLTGDPCF